MAAVLLLHPFPQDASFWDDLAARLRDRGHDVRVPDAPGFGARPLEPGWTIDGEADRLAADLPPDSTVIGLSMGGYEALALVARHPDRVGSLVLADTRAEGESSEGMDVRRATVAALRADGLAPVLDDLIPRALGRAPRPETVARLRAIADRQAIDALADATMAISGRTDRVGDLPSITAPTLVIVGEHDAPTPPDAAMLIASRIPDARLAVIGGAGHMTALEEPVEFADLVLAHLEMSARG